MNEGNLEVLLELQRKFQSHASGAQQLEQILPQSEDVVFASIDTIDVVVVLGLQLLGHGHDGLHALLVRQNVRLDGFVLLGSSFHRSQVETEIIL